MTFRDDAPGPHDPTRHQPGPEPADPWAEDEALERAEQDRWTSEPGGMGPLPSPGRNSVSRPTDPTAITGRPVTFLVQPARLSSGFSSGNPGR